MVRCQRCGEQAKEYGYLNLRRYELLRLGALCHRCWDELKVLTCTYVGEIRGVTPYRGERQPLAVAAEDERST